MLYDNTMAAAYDRGRRLRPLDVEGWMAAARPYLPDARGRVLDLGAGTGRFSAALASACAATVVACEPSTAMRAVCRTNSPPEIAVVAGTAQAAPFGDGVFDTIWASQVIHHVEDLPAFARNLRRLLTPYGHVLLRGGFGPASQSPLYQYFPDAWGEGSPAALSLGEITDLFAQVDLEQIDHVTVEQMFADDPTELIDKVRTRTLSNLARLPDAVYDEGLRHLERDAKHGAVASPIVEELDLVVFQLTVESHPPSTV